MIGQTGRQTERQRERTTFNIYDLQLLYWKVKRISLYHGFPGPILPTKPEV